MFDINNSNFYNWAFTAFINGSGKNAFTKSQLANVQECYETQNVFRLMVNHYLQLLMAQGHFTTKDGGNLSKKYPGMNERTMNLSCIINGCVILRNKIKAGETEIKGLYAQPGYGMGIFNANMDPLYAFVTYLNGSNGQQISLYPPGYQAEANMYASDGRKADDPSGFIIWDNETRVPPFLYILQYAAYITNNYRTLDTTTFWLDRPVIFMANSKKIADDIDKVIAEMGNHRKWTIQSGAVSNVSQATQFINTNANGQNLKDLTGIIQWYDSQFLAMFGFKTNAQFDKKGENLQTAEVEINDEVEYISKHARADCKNKYLEEAAELPGFDSLDIAYTLVEPEEKEMTNDNEGGIMKDKGETDNDTDDVSDRS